MSRPQNANSSASPPQRGQLDQSSRIAVTSRSFSRDATLRAELLGSYSQVTFNDESLRLEGEELRLYLDEHDAAIVGLERIDRDLISKLPRLKVISKYGVGLDSIDLRALLDHGVLLGWRGGVNKRSASELALTLILCSLRHVVAASMELLRGGWRQHVGSLLTGKSVGILGLGHVGKDLVALLRPFDCQILAHDILEFPEFCSEHDVRQVSLDKLLSDSDIVSLHVPLTEESRGIMSRDRLQAMKRGAVLINTARGGLVDEVALRDALSSGGIAAAGFDVFATEPPDDDTLLALLSLPNFVATPHIGGSAREAILAMGRAAIEQLKQARDARPENFD